MAKTMGTTLGNSSLTRRHFITILGGSAAVAGLSACALGSTNKGASPSTGPAKLDVAQTIEIWDYDPTGIDVWVAADKAFAAYFKEKYPKITIKRSQAPFTGFAEGLLTSVAGGAKYDVIYGWAPWLPQFMKNNVVSTLDPFLKNDGSVSADSFHDYGKDVVDGSTYGLAWYASADFLFYNKTALAAAGLADPAKLDAAGQWTYDAFQKLANSATIAGKKPTYGFDMGTTRGSGDYSAFSRGWGSDLWDKGFTKSLLDSPENVKLWSWIQNFYQQKLTPLPSEGSGLAEAVGFGDKRITMMISGANYFRQAAQDKVPAKFDIGMSRIPAGPGGQAHVAFLNSYFMGSRGSNAAGGWAWYKERSFSDKASALYVDTGASRFPVRKDQKPVTRYAWEDPNLFTLIGKDMYPVRVAPVQTKFDALYGAAWDNMVLKSGTPQELLTKLAADSNALLKS